jgi:uncharacterized membrane protein
MNALIAGLALFSLPHLYSILLPASRDGLRARMGAGAYKGMYSLISAVGILLVAWAYSGLGAYPEATDLVYTPVPWAKHATMTLVLLAFILIGAAHGKGYIKAWVKHPMSAGIALWAAGHLLANGERFAVWLFGAFLILALLDIVISTARGKVPAHEPRIRSDIIAVGVGLVLYAVFLFGFHPYVLNLPIVGS